MPKKTYNRLLDEHLHSLVAQGNHDAYLLLKRRYQRYAGKLIASILNDYPNSGLTYRDIYPICEQSFPFVVKRYEQQQCSFYYFWQKIVSQDIHEYMIKNSYKGEAKMFSGVISLNEEFEDENEYGTILAESDLDTFEKRMTEELENIVDRFSKYFDDDELSILKLLFDGYSYNELLQGTMMSRSKVFLTSKSAFTKLKNLIKNHHIKLF